jgi:hypothetical protein
MQTEFVKKIFDCIAKNYTHDDLKAALCNLSPLSKDDDMVLFMLEQEIPEVALSTIEPILKKHGITIKVFPDLRQDPSGKYFFTIRLIYDKSPFRVISADYSANAN